MINLDETISKFLRWKLPADFSPDCGISFVKTHGSNHLYEPIGTNLFTATQAKQMFEQCLSDDSEFNLDYTCKRIRRLLILLEMSDPSNGKDDVLIGCLFSLLGTICLKLERAKLSPAIAEGEEPKLFKSFDEFKQAYLPNQYEKDQFDKLLQFKEADTVTIPRAEYEQMKADAERYRKLKSLALTAQTSKTFAISKFEDTQWCAYELSPIDLDVELDQAIDTARRSS